MRTWSSEMLKNCVRFAKWHKNKCTDVYSFALFLVLNRRGKKCPWSGVNRLAMYEAQLRKKAAFRWSITGLNPLRKREIFNSGPKNRCWRVYEMVSINSWLLIF